MDQYIADGVQDLLMLSCGRKPPVEQWVLLQANMLKLTRTTSMSLIVR